MDAEDLLQQYQAGRRDFSRLDLKEINLVGHDLSRCNFYGSNLTATNLSGANLTHADLSQATLRTARLSGANLTGAVLEAANLESSDFKRAILIGAKLSHAYGGSAILRHVDLSRGELREAQLREVDLRDSKLDQADLWQTVLNQSDLRGCTLLGAQLEQASLHRVNLSRVDLGGANLQNADLRHANLNCANVQGTTLQGANLRWVDLNGADAQWANCQTAKLSGATLIGTNFGHANLANASLVHADLTRANLMFIDWSGADLTGVILTGAKLHGAMQLDLMIEDMTCDWVDLSLNGDRSHVHYFETEADLKRFFNQKSPTIEMVVDGVIDHTANCQLAQAYNQLAQQYGGLTVPPSVGINVRQTTLTFKAKQDLDLIAIGLLAALPFWDVELSQKLVVAACRAYEAYGLDWDKRQDLAMLLRKIQAVPPQSILKPHASPFFQRPSQMIFTDSNARTCCVYQHPNFGKQVVGANGVGSAVELLSDNASIPDFRRMVNFLHGGDNP